MAFRPNKGSKKSKKAERASELSEWLSAGAQDEESKKAGNAPSDETPEEQLPEAEPISEEQLEEEQLEFKVLDEPVEIEGRAFHDPDRESAEAFLRGSDEAFIQLYAKYEAPLLMYCRRMMVTDRLAEDVFQEIWIRIFEFRAKKAEINHFKGLLFRTARNLCLNTLRLEKYRAGSSEPLKTLASDIESHQDFEQKEIKALLKRALAKLPFEQREAFVMHEYSGYSYAEIAEIMKTTEVNVKVRAYRARTRLKKVITSWLGLAEDDDPSNVLNY